jgi:hypothetical protein
MISRSPVTNKISNQHTMANREAPLVAKIFANLPGPFFTLNINSLSCCTVRGKSNFHFDDPLAQINFFKNGRCVQLQDLQFVQISVHDMQQKQNGGRIPVLHRHFHWNSFAANIFVQMARNPQINRFAAAVAHADHFGVLQLGHQNVIVRQTPYHFDNGGFLEWFQFSGLVQEPLPAAHPITSWLGNTIFNFNVSLFSFYMYFNTYWHDGSHHGDQQQQAKGCPAHSRTSLDSD